MIKATISSVYMPNVADDIASLQKSCVEKVLPEGWTFRQHKQIDGSFSHPAALTKFAFECMDEVCIFLDIDCIPLSTNALVQIADRAVKGMLVGAVQRANHIKNNAHLYVGPFCMAFSKKKYRELSSPSFHETYRGDVGEELTYRWQENNSSIYFLWPSFVSHPVWKLDSTKEFGYGTTYENMFFHAFGIREARSRDLFIAKCNELLYQGDSECQKRHLSTLPNVPLQS